MDGGMDGARTTPVAALSVGSAWLLPRPLREHGVDDLDDRRLAALVRTRMWLMKGHGWAVFVLFVLAVSSLFVFGSALASRTVLGVWAAAVATAAAGLGFCVERTGWRFFLHLGRRQGLSDRATAAVFDRAATADRFIDVMKACGREPTDEELASFVRTATA